MTLKHNIKTFAQTFLDQALIILESINLYVAQQHTTCTSPYISGDAFISLASYIYCGSKITICDPKPKTLNNKHIAFADEKGLLTLISSPHLPHIDSVIFHNTDVAPDDISRQILFKMNIRLFSVNLYPQYSNEFTIPLGIENPSLRRASLLSTYNSYSSLAKKKTNNFLLAISVNTNPHSRAKCIDECALVGLKNESLTQSVYQQKLSASRFVISPRGNGLDTHRFWEAIYHKSVPVVLADDYLFAHLKLPVLVLTSWTDLAVFTDQILSDIYNELWSPQADYPDIFSYVWFSRILGY